MGPTLTRRSLLRAAAAGGLCYAIPSAMGATQDKLPDLITELLDAFAAETPPEGGVDVAKSPWQKPGRGAATGSPMFAGRIDPRYFRFEIEALYRFADQLGNPRYRRAADAQVAYMAREIAETHPTWAVGNALEIVGVSHDFKGTLENPAGVAQRLVAALRKRAVDVTTVDGVKFRHIPAGYGVLDAKDAGWTNDLSMAGSGLVRAFEVTGDKTILADAVSFAEYFVQPWRPDALGADGYWRCGTWHERLGSWVIGPAHYTGFESTDAYGDEASWVFSTMTCIDFLTRLHRHKPDDRYLDRCTRAARWTFKECQFDDGAVGMCDRDDKWLGFTGDAIAQVALLLPHLAGDRDTLAELLGGAERAYRYLRRRTPEAKLAGHGVEWVRRTTSTDPLVNVAMLWASFLLGWLDGGALFADAKPR